MRPMCPDCKVRSYVRYRSKSNTYICYGCGCVWEKEADHESNRIDCAVPGSGDHLQNSQEK